MYSKYQEAIDALRHEQLGRKESEAVLQRVWLTWCIFFMYNLKIWWKELAWNDHFCVFIYEWRTKL